MPVGAAVKRAEKRCRILRFALPQAEPWVQVSLIGYGTEADRASLIRPYAALTADPPNASRGVSQTRQARHPARCRSLARSMFVLLFHSVSQIERLAI